MSLNNVMLGTIIEARKSGKLNDFFYDVSLGKVIGAKAINKYGFNPEVSTTEFESVWNGGGLYTGFNAIEAQTVELFSDSIEDYPAGTGLGRVKLYGLDANFFEITEEIDLNGTSSVLTTKLFIRCDRIKGVGDGTLSSNKSNIGTITARQSTTIVNVFAKIPIGHNSTMIACYTIPANRTGYMLSRGASIAKKQASAIEVRMKTRAYGGVPQIAGYSAITSTGTSFAADIFPVPVRFEAKTDICIEAGNASSVSGIAAQFAIICSNKSK